MLGFVAGGLGGVAPVSAPPGRNALRAVCETRSVGGRGAALTCDVALRRASRRRTFAHWQLHMSAAAADNDDDDGGGQGSGYAAEQDYPSDSYARSSATAGSASGATARATTGNFDREAVNELKFKLLQLAASTGRGELATTQQKSAIEELVNELESMSPTAAPVESPELDGVWQLSYSSSALHRLNPLLLPSVTPLQKIGQVYQTINLDLGELVNEVEVVSFPNVSGSLVTTARVAPVDARRLEVNVEKVTVKGKELAGRLDLGGIRFDLPVERIYERLMQRGPSPETYFETFFLDTDLRISRGKDGTLFVFTRSVA